MRILEPYNPLGVKNLGISVADALLRQPVSSLPPAEPFIAAGIYAIYYHGEHEVYRRIAERNRDERYELPIYIGKAVPRGARTGGVGLGGSPGRVMYERLREHAESIDHALDLEPADFRCRFLAVEDIWIPLGESLLIETFAPLWNHPLSGFGNHDPGSGRSNQQRSKWDQLHPGRPWAKRLKDLGTTSTDPNPDVITIRARLLSEVEDHLVKSTAARAIPHTVGEADIAGALPSQLPTQPD